MLEASRVYFEFSDRINCFVQSYDVVDFARSDVAMCDVAVLGVLGALAVLAVRYVDGAEHGVEGGAWDDDAYTHDTDVEHKQRNGASDGKPYDAWDDRHGAGDRHNDAADDKRDEAVHGELELGPERRDGLALEHDQLVLRQAAGRSGGYLRLILVLAVQVEFVEWAELAELAEWAARVEPV